MKEIHSTRSSDEVNKSPGKSECLVLLAHGSKDPRWRVPFERIVDAVQGQSGETKVSLAYMEFLEPTLIDVARECVGQQILHLKILPLFFSIGAHLAIDVPEQVNQAKAQFPQLEVEVLSPIGEDPRLTGLIQQIVMETLKH
ncbi:MAG TPA: CbiX/SirB N-terminal domain-containing protein [Candidatus Limnocylindrales bacterium]|nr:CbiX/SirB N-terminal domain-containing protein [Candidatus Limnocylindrales bacterium]